MISRVRFEKALKEALDASFECGEWNRDDSDEDWEDVYERSNKANAKLRKLVEPFLTPPLEKGTE